MEISVVMAKSENLWFRRPKMRAGKYEMIKGSSFQDKD